MPKIKELAKSAGKKIVNTGRKAKKAVKRKGHNAKNKIKEKLGMKIETEEERAQRKENEDPMSHRVQTGQVLSMEELGEENEDSDNFKMKENLVKRLIHVQKNNDFMHLITNLPEGKGEEKISQDEKDREKLSKVEEGREGIGKIYDVADAAVSIAAEIKDNVEMPGILDMMSNFMSTCSEVKQLIIDLYEGKKDLTFENVVDVIDKAISHVKETEGILANFLDTVPLVGDLMSIISDGIHLLKTGIDIVSANSNRKEAKNFIKFNFSEQKKDVGKNRDDWRNAAISHNAQGEEVDSGSYSRDQYRESWQKLSGRKAELLKKRNTEGLSAAEEEEFKKLVKDDRYMRSLVAFEMMRKQDIAYRDAWKEFAQTMTDFLADVAGFINPLAGAIGSGVSSVLKVSSWAVTKLRRLFINHDKKNRARGVFASYLYNHMKDIHDSGHVANDKFDYQLPDNPENAAQFVRQENHTGDAQEQSEFYEMADNASYTEKILSTNGMDYAEASSQKTVSGLISVMAGSFSSEE